MILIILVILFILVAGLLLMMILIQPGRGYGLESSQGVGFSATVFGSSGPYAIYRQLASGLTVLFYSLVVLLGAMISNDRISQYNLENELEETEILLTGSEGQDGERELTETSEHAETREAGEEEPHESDAVEEDEET